jgi:adenylate cyclase
MGATLVRRARLVSGLVLFSYVLTHLSNLAVGLVSVAAMDRVLVVLYHFWTSIPATAAFYGAGAVHVLLALWALWQRRSLRLTLPTATQYVLGFSIPLIALQHAVGTRVPDTFFDTDWGYYRSLVTVFWYLDPVSGALQALLVVIVWIHASIGLRYRLRLEPWYARVQPLLFAAAVLFPALALLGYAEAGREVLERIGRDPAFLAAVLQARPPDAVREVLEPLVFWGRIGFLGALALVLLARVVRRIWQARHGLIRIAYPDGRFINVVRGTSVLEASRILGVPHAAICGGKGRCSTCRVRVRGASGALPPPSGLESAVLKRIGAAVNVRLACQLRPTGDIEAAPLLPPFVHAREGFRRAGYRLGAEKEIAILFADLRDFTRLAESKLPYDVVFVLNRYFGAMGKTIEEAGGRVDKFIGDGIMALFGLESGAAAGARQALAAAQTMSVRLEELNRTLEHEIDAPLQIGIGLHLGPVIVGEMGYGPATQLTAVGDAVNTASRLESLCKELGVELVVSEETVAKARADLTAFPPHEVAIRGRRQPLVVRAVARACDLGEANRALIPA